MTHSKACDGGPECTACRQAQGVLVAAVRVWGEWQTSQTQTKAETQAQGKPRDSAT